MIVLNTGNVSGIRVFSEIIMATLRDIKTRIQGVKNTQQITKAMKMVAAARLRRAQENILNARPYSKKIGELLSDLLSLEKEFKHELLEKREVEKVAIITVTSDRGLCGGFNMNAIRATEHLIKGEYKEFLDSGNLELHTIGKKASDYFKRNFELSSIHNGIFSGLKYDFAAQFVKNLSTRYLNGEIDKVVVVYNEFVNVASQNIIEYQLLPIQPETEDKDETAFGEYIYEPNKKEIIDALLPKHLNAQMWTILLNSYAAELGARMTAMDMATENAKELIRSLQITYNKERQAAITTEILEIVSGANALNEAG